MAPKQDATVLNPQQVRDLIYVGGSLGEIYDLAERGFSFDDMKGLFELQQQQQRQKDSDARTHQAESSAAAMKRALMPENQFHPGHSVYSYPEGDKKRPRPTLRCPTFWLNSPMEGDVDTVEEIELANQLVAGEYICSKSDGTRIKVTVTAEKDPVTDAYQKVIVLFPTRGMLRHNLRPKTEMMREMIAQAADRQKVAVPA